MSLPRNAMLPNVIIIGAAKCGTTSLHRYLGMHPEVLMATPENTASKEMRFFWRDDWRQRRAWYEAHFETDRAVRAEATPAYTAYPFHPGVPERMAELVPDAKLIYLVRDPVARIISHYVQRRADADRTPFRRYMQQYDQPGNPIVCPSRYWTQIEQFLAFYDPAQIMVVDQQRLKVDRRETLREIHRFIGVDDSFDSPEYDIEQNTRADKYGPRGFVGPLWRPVLWPLSRAIPVRAREAIREPASRVLMGPVRAKPQIDVQMRERLRALLAPEVEKLRTFTGQAFSSWSL